MLIVRITSINTYYPLLIHVIYADIPVIPRICNSHIVEKCQKVEL